MAPENGRHFFSGRRASATLKGDDREGTWIVRTHVSGKNRRGRDRRLLHGRRRLGVRPGQAGGSGAPTAPAAAPAPPPSKPDPAGTATGGIADITAKTAGKPTLEEIADFAGHNRVAVNMMWTLVTGFLVMFMQAGFALVETGFCRAKNVAHTMMMNFMVYAIGMLGYWICGFALHMGGIGAICDAWAATRRPRQRVHASPSFGKDLGLFGMKGFFLAGATYDVGVFALFLFQMVFMDTAATIPTGAMAERWKFSSFVHLRVLHLDVHLSDLRQLGVGRRLAVAARARTSGWGTATSTSPARRSCTWSAESPRWPARWCSGRVSASTTRTASPNAIPGHNIPMAALGMFILAFGWFGFNPGSTLAGSRPAHRRDRRQHDAGVGGRRLVRDVLHVGQVRQARPEHDDQRHAGRPGRDHRAVRLRQLLGVS